jgi:hypothetical protein
MSTENLDRLMMMHCISIAKASGKAGEYPYDAVACRDGVIVAESINRVIHDGDVHALPGRGDLAGTEGPRHDQPRRLRNLRECGTLRILQLRDPREQDPPGCLRT